MRTKPHFIAATDKVLESIVFVADRPQPMDLYHVVKALYFADKYHIQKHGRPIAGDGYDAAQYGPLAQVAYGLLKGDPLEMLALGGNGGALPFSVTGRQYLVTTDRSATMSVFSKSDIEALKHGIGEVEGKSFDDLYRITHADPAYIRADGGLIDPRDYIPDEDKNADKKREYIAENASAWVF
jgi:hypothetical protein